MDLMNDYCYGIGYATGYIARENGKSFLFVRNLDPYYSKAVEKETKYKAYKSRNNMERDGRFQWCIKVRDVQSLPSFQEIKNAASFIRAYMEVHSTLDLMNMKDRKGEKIKRLRLRIYGNEKILSWINDVLPAKKKKIQYIKNIVDTEYIGETCCIYYQSRKEILEILNWIDDYPRHEKIWKMWNEILLMK